MTNCLFLRPYLGLGVGVLDNEGPKDLCQDKGWVPPPREEGWEHSLVPDFPGKCIL